MSPARQKRMLVIAYGELLKCGSAGTTVMCGLVGAALATGWQVSYLGLTPISYDIPTSGYFDFSRFGTALRTDRMQYRFRSRTPWRSIRHSFDNTGLYEIVSHSLFLEEQYAAVLSFESLAYDLATSVSADTHFTIIGDPASEKLRFIGLTGSPLKKFIVPRIVRIEEKRFWKRQMPKLGGVGMFGTRHAREWSSKLGQEVVDLRPMIPPMLDEDRGRTTSRPLTLAFGGSLGSSATRFAVGDLRTTIRQALTDVLGSNYELQIIGQGRSEWTEALKDWPQVKVVGAVRGFEAALQGVDVFLLPIRYPVGVRTRICSALQAGCYCIADPALLGNMPELEDKPFVVFAGNATEFAAAIRRFVAFSDKRRLREAAQRFFKHNYSFDIASEPILRRLGNEELD